MCWVALIPVAAAVVGGMMQGNAAKAQAGQQALQQRTNALYAQDAANDAQKRGAYDADLQRVRTGQAIGTQRAAMAGNGGEVNSGSNALLQEDTAALGELDALTIQNNAAREAYGYKVQALTGFSNARQTEANGETAQRSSILGGIIKGAGSYFGSSGFGGFGGGTGSGTSAALGAGNYGANVSYGSRGNA